MPRVVHVKKARKSNKNAGVKKGQEYWWWSVMIGGRGCKRYSLTKPKPSQLTNSEFWSTVYGIQEAHEGPAPEWDSIESSIEDVKSQLEELRDETQGKYDNMPDGLQQGDTGQLLEFRVASLEDCISELENIDITCEEDDEPEEGETKEETENRVQCAKDEKAQEAWGALHDALGNISD